MKTVLPFTLLALALAACSAPQGKKYSATNRELPPIALPEPVKQAELYDSQSGNIVALKPDGTLTISLSSNHKSGFAWRLAEIPDATVLKWVSTEYLAPTATSAGQEKWIFKAVGEGDVDVRLWYTSPRPEQFGSAPVFKCTVAVTTGLAPVAKGPDGKNIVPVKRPHAKPHARSHAKPKAHPTVPDQETSPFLQPIFRSSGVLLRDKRDGTQEQG